MGWSPTTLLELPGGSASASQVLQNDGSGGLSWADVESIRTGLAVSNVLESDGANALQALERGQIITSSVVLTGVSGGFTATYPDDNTPPTDSEGIGLEDDTVTIKRADSRILIVGLYHVGNSGANRTMVALHVDSQTNANKVGYGHVNGNLFTPLVGFVHEAASPGVGAMQIEVRVGVSAGTGYVGRPGIAEKMSARMGGGYFFVEYLT